MSLTHYPNAWGYTADFPATKHNMNVDLLREKDCVGYSDKRQRVSPCLDLPI